eukprot:TRINITY_DN7006_c0_g1_i1.p1 TRINITY_DN7006_c0_g1~~TRINITY_DN7006_c0_g1_i1.p1  ORF type:complete len:282 (-),score=49.52 TRINITY_DN7006_c0_g1_i1:65-910(-)
MLSKESSRFSFRQNLGLHTLVSAPLAVASSIPSPLGCDSFDITFTPRPFSGMQNLGKQSSEPFTPRQKDLKAQLQLPSLQTYPIPPNSSADEKEEVRTEKLLAMYHDFALDLHTGMYLTQLTSNRDYSDIHCQLMEDLTTLKLDQSNGRIIEFPLTNVSKVYRIVKNDDKWYSAGTPLPNATPANTEQIVVVEFMRRKLAFVFKDLQTSQRFLICMELLIRRAQQKQALRSLTPAFPPPGAGPSRQCPTPRLVHDAMSRPTPSPGSAGKRDDGTLRLDAFG